MPRTLATLAIALVALTTGCAQPAEPSRPQSQMEESPAEPSTAVEALYERIGGYSEWTPAAGYDMPAPAKGPHGEQVRILLDPTAEEGALKAALSSADPNSHSWPQGSIIVKEILSGGKVIQLAAMEKTPEGWHWGEWSAEGEPVVEEGVGVEPCEGCHSQGGTDGTLGVLLAR